jgi:hypothetical protein
MAVRSENVFVDVWAVRMKQSFTLPWPPSVNSAYGHRAIKRGGAQVYLTESGRRYKQDAALNLMSQGAVAVYPIPSCTVL